MSREIPLPEKPDDDRDAALFAELDAIKVEDGVEYDPLSLRSQQWIERTSNSPQTLFDENVPWRYWKGLAAHMKAICRRTQNDALRSAREMAHQQALAFAKVRVNAMTPFRSQFELHDNLAAKLILPLPDDTPQKVILALQGLIGEALRFWREENYRYFNREYLARNVG